MLNSFGQHSANRRATTHPCRADLRAPSLRPARLPDTLANTRKVESMKGCIAFALVLILGGSAAADGRCVNTAVNKPRIDKNRARLNAAFAAFVERKYHEAKR